MNHRQELIKGLNVSADEMWDALRRRIKWEKWSRRADSDLFKMWSIPSINNTTRKYENTICKSRIIETLKTWPAKGRLWVSFSMPPADPPVTSDDWDDIFCNLIEIRNKATFRKIWDGVVCSLESHHDRAFGWISTELFWEKLRWKYVYHFHYDGESHILMQFYIRMDDEFSDEWREAVCGECSRGVKTDVDWFCEDGPMDCSGPHPCDGYDYNEHYIEEDGYDDY